MLLVNLFLFYPFFEKDLSLLCLSILLLCIYCLLYFYLFKRHGFEMNIRLNVWSLSLYNFLYFTCHTYFIMGDFRN